MKFFVYGTLKRGYGNHNYLKDSTFLGLARSMETYTLYNCGFPLAYRDREGFHVEGEIYEVEDPKVVSDLDQLEGNGIFYLRTEREFWLKGQRVTAWIYEIPDKKFYHGAVCSINENNNYEWKR